MNFKRLILAIVAVFLGIWLTDFLIHAVWLRADYLASANMWRSETEMQSHIAWLFLGEFLAAVTFVLLWAKGFAATGCLRCACLYGAFMGLFSQAATIITYAVQPLPPALAVKWFLSGTAQGLLIGVIVFFTYKPKPQTEALG